MSASQSIVLRFLIEMKAQATSLVYRYFSLANDKHTHAK